MTTKTLLTENQLGRLMGEFNRLGFYKPAYRWREPSPWMKEKIERERVIRLDIISRFTQREISSARELTRDEAGWLIAVLTDCETYSELLGKLAEYESEQEEDTTKADFQQVAVMVRDTIAMFLRPSAQMKTI